MPKFISLLRGINVSGQKKIIMAELKVLYEKAGCLNVVTYIQSGNVIFDHPENDINLIRDILEKAVEDKYAFHVPIDLRTREELQAVFDQMPFENVNIDADGSRILIGFMSNSPEQEGIDNLRKFQHETEELIIIDDILYLHCPNGFGRSKLSNTNIEKKLNVTATTRNLKTVAKLCSLAQEKA